MPHQPENNGLWHQGTSDIIKSAYYQRGKVNEEENKSLERT